LLVFHGILLVIDVLFSLFKALVEVFADLSAHSLIETKISSLLLVLKLLDFVNQVIATFVLALDVHKSLMKSRCLHFSHLLVSVEIVNTG